jgi:thiol-disulfide isomerase/thioredoxin
MKYFFTISFLACFFSITFCQDVPAPNYLTVQDFPDSVKSLVMQSETGKQMTFGEMLESYQGKKVFIDIWGSWCRDCIVGYPKVEELRKNVGEKNVVFVFLSTDKEKQKWKNAILKFGIRGEHYLLQGAWTNSLCNYLVLDWVPRYVVLDEQGKVIMPKAVVAEDSAIKKALRIER